MHDCPPTPASKSPFPGEYRLQWSLLASVWVHAAAFLVAPVFFPGGPQPAGHTAVLLLTQRDDPRTEAEPAPAHEGVPDDLARLAPPEPLPDDFDLASLRGLSAPQDLVLAMQIDRQLRSPDLDTPSPAERADASPDPVEPTEPSPVDCAPQEPAREPTDLDPVSDLDEQESVQPEQQKTVEKRFVRVEHDLAEQAAPSNAEYIAAHDTQARVQTRQPVTAAHQGPTTTLEQAQQVHPEPAGGEATATAAAAARPGRAGPEAQGESERAGGPRERPVDPILQLQADLGWAAPAAPPVAGQQGYAEAPGGTASAARPATASGSPPRVATAAAAGSAGPERSLAMLSAGGEGGTPASSTHAATTRGASQADHRTATQGVSAPSGAAATSPQTVVRDAHALDPVSRVNAADTPHGRYTERVYAILHGNWHAVDLDVDARARGVQGSVTVRFRIASSGRVSDIEVLEPSGHREIDRMALVAIPPRLPRFGTDLPDPSLVQVVTFTYGNPLVAPVKP